MWSVILFFIYTWGLGFTATYFVKNEEHSLERQLIRVGIGLGIFPILSILLNFLHIPLDWRIFLLLSITFPLFILIKKIKNKQLTKPKFTFKLTKSNIPLLIVLLIVLFSLYIYTKGAFGYPYLEDQDPWGHAVGVKYVALEKNAYDPQIEGNTIDPALSYIDPYPPAYDVLLGILHQTNPSINWTLKFFNALIISLSFLFFYFFAKEFTGDRNKALFATFILAAIPSYLSHFIWAHSLVVTLFFPLMYAIERIKVNKKWLFIAAIILASVWVIQNLEQPLKLTTLLLFYLIIKSVILRKFQKHVAMAIVLGLVLSLLWWGVMFGKYGFYIVSYYDQSTSGEGTISPDRNAGSFFVTILNAIPNLFDPGGTATRPYSLGDFVIAHTTNMINNPIGIGLFLSILVLISVIYILIKKRKTILQADNAWILVSLVWLVYTFLGVNGATFNIWVAKAAFRIWMLMAIPIALISAEGIVLLMEKSRKLKIPPSLIVGIFVIGILLTSGYPKYTVNTAIWPTASAFIAGPQEAMEYAKWFNTLPKDTPVFFASRSQDRVPIGFDAYSCGWCQSVIDFRKGFINQTIEEIHTFLKENKYEYIVIGRMDFKYVATDAASQEKLNNMINEMAGSSLFRLSYQSKDIFVVFKVL